MEEISARKRLKIIQLHLDSKSVREIASQVGVAVGTVANVIADAKNGRMPQIQEPGEQIQLARELKADLKTSHVTLEQAVLGATLVGHILGQGIDPSDMEPSLNFCAGWPAKTPPRMRSGSPCAWTLFASAPA